MLQQRKHNGEMPEPARPGVLSVASSPVVVELIGS
jgi:hypothetical protein